MKKLINVLVFALTAIILSAGLGYVFGYDKAFVRDILAILGIILSLAILVFFLLKSKTATNAVGGFFFGDLKQSIEDFLSELPKPKNSTVASLSSQVILRLTRIGIIGLIISFVPIWLLYSQNKLLSNQTTLMGKQTEILEVQNQKIQQQNLLQEASRRNNLQFEISSILDLINQELKQDYLDNEIRDLSPELTGRVLALNSRLEPYYFMEGKNLIEKPLSPERGQLFISLINSKLDSFCLKNLLSKLDLKSMDLRNASINDIKLNGLDFSDSDFSYSKFNNVVFSDVKFKDIQSWKSQFTNCIFSSSYLLESNFGDSKFENVDFTGSSMFKTNFWHSIFNSTVWNHVFTNRIDFSECSFDKTYDFETLETHNSFQFLDFTHCNLHFKDVKDIEQLFKILSFAILSDTKVRNQIIAEKFRILNNYHVENDTVFKISAESDTILNQFLNPVRYIITRVDN